ncbi:ABC transporter permease [Heyndrickxia sporothermodurans]
MKNIGVFTSFYMKTLWKSKKAVLSIFFIPIILLAGLGFVGTQIVQKDSRIDPFYVAMVNDDPTFETKMVIRQLTDNESLNKLMRTIQTNSEKAEELLKNNKVAAIIHIPKGFSSDVAHGINTPVKVVGNNQRPLQSQLVRYLMRSAADLTSAAQSGINTIDDYMKKMDFPETERKKELRKNVVTYAFHVLGRGEIYQEKKLEVLFQRNLLQYYILSFYALLIMVWGYSGLLLFSSRMNPSVQLRLFSVGVSQNQIVFAKLFTLLLFIAPLSLILGVPVIWWMELEVIPFILITLVIVLTFVSFFLFLEALLRSERAYQLVGVTFIILGIFAGGHLIPTIYFPEWLEKLSMYILNSWVLSLILSIFQGDWTEPITVLLVLIFVFIVLTSLCLKRGRVI